MPGGQLGGACVHVHVHLYLRTRHATCGHVSVCVNTQSTRRAGAGLCVPCTHTSPLFFFGPRVYTHECTGAVLEPHTLATGVHPCTPPQRRAQVAASVLAGKCTCTVHSVVYMAQ